MFEIKTTANRRKIKVFFHNERICSITVEADIQKISVDGNNVILSLANTKVLVYDLPSGELLRETAHNGNCLPKSEKKLRKQQYLSRLANQIRNEKHSA